VQMKKSLKIASIAALLLAVLGVVAFVYAEVQNNLALASDQQTGNQFVQSLLESNNITIPGNGSWPCRMGRGGGRQMMENGGLQFAQFFSENTTLSTVQGTVVSQTRDLLILNTDSGQVRVMIPKEWTVGGEIANAATLFNGTFVSQGQSVTVSVLKSDLFSNASVSVNVMLAYEAVNGAGTHAYAVLPFNIQPAS